MLGTFKAVDRNIRNSETVQCVDGRGQVSAAVAATITTSPDSCAVISALVFKMLKRWSLFKCCFSTKEVKQEERPSRPKTSDLDLKVWAPTGIENQNAIIPGKVMIDPDVES